MPQHERSEYRLLIGTLVEECRTEGQALPQRVRSGVWNRYALDHPDEMPEEHRMNSVLERLDVEDRDAVASMLERAHVAVVHDTLRLLHDNEVPPFDRPYESTPYQDFVGLLQGDWEWPT